MSFGPLQSPFEDSGVHWDFNSQSGSSFGECGGSFPHTLLHSWEHEMWIPGPFLAHTFTSPCLGRELKAKVATQMSTHESDDDQQVLGINTQLQPTTPMFDHP
jgi:hypothetical protein